MRTRISLGIIASLLLVVFVYAASVYGSFSAAIACLDGQVIYPEVSLRKCNNSSRSVTFPVRNLLAKEVTLHGAESGCYCISSTSFPVTIPPLSVVELKFSVSDHAEQGMYNLKVFAEGQTLDLFLDVTQ